MNALVVFRGTSGRTELKLRPYGSFERSRP